MTKKRHIFIVIKTHLRREIVWSEDKKTNPHHDDKQQVTNLCLNLAADPASRTMTFSGEKERKRERERERQLDHDSDIFQDTTTTTTVVNMQTQMTCYRGPMIWPFIS